MEKRTINPNDLSRSMFIEELQRARAKAGSDYKLAVALGIQQVNIYRWMKNVGPRHRVMVEMYEKLVNM